MWLLVKASHSTPALGHLRKQQRYLILFGAVVFCYKLGFHPDAKVCCTCVWVPGLRCPTVSARLPFRTFVIKAQSLPDSVILPPTTWRESEVTWLAAKYTTGVNTDCTLNAPSSGENLWRWGTFLVLALACRGLIPSKSIKEEKHEEKRSSFFFFFPFSI